jgi:hypothetical protein
MRALILPIAALGLVGCANLQPVTITPNEERLAMGAAAGALGGLAIGSLGAEAGVGALVGAGVGLAGSAIYNHYLRHQRETYEAGYRAGQARRPPQPPS